MSDYDLLQSDAYSLRTEGDGFRVTKFTKDLNPIGFYHIKSEDDGNLSCNCPQSNRGHCRHIDIVDAYGLYPERIDKGWFLCYQTGDWFPPISSSIPAAGGGEAVDPSTASPITPEVEETPPSPPSGVMTFSSPLKRRI